MRIKNLERVKLASNRYAVRYSERLESPSIKKIGIKIGLCFSHKTSNKVRN